MRSMSGDGWQGSRRGIDNAADEVAVGEPALSGRRGKACIGVEARIDVNFEDRWSAFAIDAEVDAGIAGKPEQVPAGFGELLQVRGKRRLGLFQPDAARRAGIGIAVARPFGVIPDDARAPLTPILEHDLGDRQHAGAATLLKQREVELAPLDETFRKMLGAEPRNAVGDDAGSVSALYHRALVEPERAMLPHRLADDLCIRIEACAVNREAGRGQVFTLKLQLGRDL